MTNMNKKNIEGGKGEEDRLDNKTESHEIDNATGKEHGLKKAAKSSTPMTSKQSSLRPDTLEVLNSLVRIERHLVMLADTVQHLLSELTVMRTLMEPTRRDIQVPRATGVRLGIYVDVQNLYYAARDLGGKVDYKRLKEWIVGSRKLEKANAYIILNPSIPDQEKFLHALENYGFYIRSKVIKTFYDGHQKGNWDLGMAMDMIEDSEYLDIVALVSGDGDFAPVVRMLRRNGVKVEVYSFLHSLSYELREAADSFFPLSEEFLLKDSTSPEERVKIKE